MIQTKELIYEYEKRDEEGNIIGMKRAIDGVDIDIPEGSFVAILGHNGSGKSTLAKHINALLLPTEGSIWIDGTDTKAMDELWKIRQKAGMVFQNPDNQIIGTVVEEDVGFGPENMGIPTGKIWKRVDKSLESVGMTAFRHRSPNKLSGGQKQRVAIAGVLAMHPKCIILDEPTVGLDPKQIIEIRDLIKSLGEKHTVILSSHILAEIREVCDYILIISKGKLVASDTPDRLEEKMSGTETVEILAKASAAEVRAILLNVEHISNIHTQERADKTCSARIQTEGGCDIREALFFAFAKNECPLLELQTSRISLEEVFLELTQNDAVGEEERTNAGNL